MRGFLNNAAPQCCSNDRGEKIKHYNNRRENVVYLTYFSNLVSRVAEGFAVRILPNHRASWTGGYRQAIVGGGITTCLGSSVAHAKETPEQGNLCYIGSIAHLFPQ